MRALTRVNLPNALLNDLRGQLRGNDLQPPLLCAALIAEPLPIHPLPAKQDYAHAISTPGHTGTSGSCLPIQPPVLHGLRDVVGLDILLALHVGDGAGDAEDLVVGAGGEAHLRHGLLEEGLAGGVQLAELTDLAGGHGGVGRRGVRLQI